MLQIKLHSIFLFLCLVNFSVLGIFPNNTYRVDQKYKILSKIDSIQKQNHGKAEYIDDLLLIPFSVGQRDGGVHFFDIKDTAKPIYRCSILDNEIREGHIMAFHRDTQDRAVIALLATNGIQLWRINSLCQFEQLSYLKLPGINDEKSDYENSSWWLSWSGRYLYVSGSTQGFYVIDTLNLNAPSLINRFSAQDYALDRIGSLFAFGEQLILTENANGLETKGFSTASLNDPIQPQFLFNSRNNGGYSYMLNGNRLYEAGLSWAEGLKIYDVSNIDSPRLIAQKSPEGNQNGVRGGYLSISDTNDIHFGASSFYVKMRYNPVNNSISQLGTARFESSLPDADLDFASVLSNIVVVGDDDGHGSRIYVHQASADQQQPSLNAIHPNLNNNPTLNQNGMIGLSFSEPLSFDKIKQNTFVIQNLLTQKTYPTFISYQSNRIGISSRELLDTGSPHRLIINKTQIQDLVGNAIDSSLLASYDFKTSGPSPISECQLIAPKEVVFNESHSYEVNFCKDPNNITGVKWAMGEGSPQNKAYGEILNYAYQQPGAYVIAVTIQYKSGEQKVLSQRILVTRQLSSQKSLTSRSLLKSQKTKIIWALNPDNNSVSLFNEQLKFIKEISVGQEPSAVTEVNDEIWITLKKEHKIARVSQLDHTVQKINLAYGDSPEGILFLEDTQDIWVASYGSGHLYNISQNGEILDKRFICKTLKGMSYDPIRKQFLLTQFISPKDQGSIYLIDQETMRIRKKIHLAYDESIDTEVSGSGIPNYVFRAIIAPDGNRTVVVSKKDNVKRGEGQNGQSLNFHNTVRAIASQINLSSKSEIVDQRIDLNNRNLPIDALYSTKGDKVFILSAGSGSLDAYDSETNSFLSTSSQIAAFPDSMIYDEAKQRILINSLLDRELISVSIKDFDQQRELNVTQRTYKVRNEKMTPQELLGKKVFYDSADLRMAKDNYMSCATCHFSGDDDGRVWDFTQFNEGIRATTSLLAKFKTNQNYRIHWSGNFDEMQDFENIIRNRFLGHGFLSDQQFNSSKELLGLPKKGLSRELDALTKYIESLKDSNPSPYKNANGSFSPSALRGQNVFSNNNCQQCHAGNAFTDSVMNAPFHNVGSFHPLAKLNKIDTPELKGLWSRNVLLHHGQATSLKDVFESFNNGGLHGNLNLLSDQDKRDLYRFLLEL